MSDIEILARHVSGLSRRIDYLMTIEQTTSGGGGGTAVFDDAGGDPANIALISADGVSSYAARRDHRHALAGTVVQSLGTAYFAGTAEVTPGTILGKLLPIDGTGSGLDADFLDGFHATAFSGTAHTHSQYAGTAEITAGTILAKLLTVDGAGTGLDADLLDGVQLSSIMGSITGFDINSLTGTVLSNDVDATALVNSTTGAFFPYYATSTGSARKINTSNLRKLLWNSSEYTSSVPAQDDRIVLVDWDSNGFPKMVSIANMGTAILTSLSAVDGTGSGLDADTVDGAHYAEGTWSPQLQFGGANVGMTQATASGTYAKIGKSVFVSVRITLSAKGSSTGNASIAGLPFTGSGGNDRYIFPCRFVNGTVAAGDIRAALDAAAPDTLVIFVQNGASSSSATDANFANNTTIQASGWYLAA